jgi:hypothetical protein
MTTPTTMQAAPPQLILRDIHLPQPVSWWPPAPGWWLVLGAVILLTITLILFLRRRHKRRYQRIALQQLCAWEQGLDNDYNPQQLMQQLSQLLRQMATLHYPPQQCAGLHAEEWLNFLDQPFQTKNQEQRPQGDQQPFSAGIGRCLADGPYQSAEQAANTLDVNNAKELIQLARRWIKTLPLATTARRSA